jgi:hypothetical protein
VWSRKEETSYPVGNPAYYRRYSSFIPFPFGNSTSTQFEGPARLETWTVIDNSVSDIQQTASSLSFKCSTFQGVSLQFDIVLSDEVTHDRMLSTLRTIATSFNTNLFYTQPGKIWSSEYRNDGTILTSEITTTVPICSTSPVAGLEIATDIPGFNAASKSFSYWSSANARRFGLLVRSRIETPSAWCLHTKTVSSALSCLPLRRPSICGPTQTVYFENGSDVLVGEQANPPSDNYGIYAFNGPVPGFPCNRP